MAERQDFAKIKLSRPALDLLESKRDAAAFLEAAVQKGMLDDALAFPAQWLPARSAVWWGCLCLWQVQQAVVGAESRAALRAAADWCLHPDEKRCRAAETASKAVPLDNPAGNLALAAFHTGESMAPVGQPAVPPPPDLANEMVVSALAIICARLRPDGKDKNRAQFARLAIDICRGKIPWPPTNGR